MQSYELLIITDRYRQDCFRLFSELCTMQVLVVAATSGEITPAMNFFHGKGTDTFQVEFHCTGVGLTAATFEITRLALTQSPDLIIQAGIAGSFTHPPTQGEVVMIATEETGDMGVWENGSWKNMTELALLPSDSPPYETGLLPNPYLAAFSFLGLSQATGISVNQITTDQKMLEELQKKHPTPLIESMEGAALHYACRMLQIPFLQLRGISNLVGERNKSNWNISLAIEQVNQTLIQLLTSIAIEPLDFSSKPNK